jgi:uncharacterized protein
MSVFSIDLATLTPGRHRVSLECDAAALGLPPEGWPGPIRGSFDVEKSGEQVTVRGRVMAVAALECVRCLRAIEAGVEAPLDVFAERARPARRLEEQLLERDDFMKFHDGRLLDLSDEARESLLLELPMAPRCREDCQGLCPVCGADWNIGTCSHR